MKMKIFTLATIILLLTGIGISFPNQQAAAAGNYGGYSLTEARDLIFQKTNEARVNAGLQPLRMTIRLNYVAQSWSERMAYEQTMYHNPNYSSQYPAGWSRAAENVAYGYTPDSVVAAWMGSTGHKANILRPEHNYIGIGVGVTSSGRLYFTQDFAQYNTTPSDVIVSSSPPDPTFTPTVVRLAGSDRYATSIAISSKFTPNVPVVFIANGLGFPDALTASAAAAKMGGPLLLTPSNNLPNNIRAEIERLNPARIIVVGGEGVISNQVFNQLKTIQPNTQRYAGSNRYLTSIALTKEIFPSSDTAFIVTGTNYPDSLSASSAAGTLGYPIVLVPSLNNSSILPENTKQLLADIGVTKVYIVGGTGVVSSRIETDLKTLLGSDKVTRYSGSDRYATSYEANRNLFPTTADQAFLAVGTGYADALGGAAYAGNLDSPLYLTKSSCVPRNIINDMKRLGVTKVTLLGGTGVLDGNVAALKICS